MDNEEKHYPGQEEPTPQEEPQAEEPQNEEPTEEPQKEEPKEEEKTEEPSEPINKKRSIYEDYKEKKAEAKEAKAEADAAKARVAELEQLLEQRNDAKTPEEKAEAQDELDAYAEEQGLDAAGLKKLVGLIQSRIQPGQALTEEERTLLADYKTDREARMRAAEDTEVRSHAVSVQKELSIHDPNELQAVMDKLVELSHTSEFHDKEVDYILWKNRDVLSKMVSPKRPSFESGDTRPDGEGEADIDFSKGGVTPQMAEKATYNKSRPSYEIERGR